MDDDMKLVSFKAEERNRVGVVLGDKILDLAAAGKMYQSEVGSDSDISTSDDMIQFLNLGDQGIRAAKCVTAFIERKLSLSEMSKSQSSSLLYAIQNVKLNAPVVNPRKIVCLGLNYFDLRKKQADPNLRSPSCSQNL